MHYPVVEVNFFRMNVFFSVQNNILLILKAAWNTYFLIAFPLMFLLSYIASTCVNSFFGHVILAIISLLL